MRRWTRGERSGGDGPEEGSDDEEDDIPDGDIVAWLSQVPIKGRGAPPGNGSDGSGVAADYAELLAHLRNRRGSDDGGPPEAEDEDEDEDEEGKVGGAEDRVERSTADGKAGLSDANEDLGDGFIAF